ncbi:TetR/AcrR family transcriptional regulator [Phaeovulum sp.]|uniref:TetR/AcrR family transcriptional regulator n=1 Tax=Phaeovulum sp. TaxID=2934796 RepID=UPI003564B483
MAARKSAESRKTEIVAAMLRLADELGPDRLTTQAVATAVGLTQPGIFRHFPTKQDLWQAVALHITETMLGAWDEVMATDAAPQDRLAALIGVQLRQISANPAIPAILHSRELHAENAPLRATFMGVMTRFQTMLVNELQRGRDSGVFRADLVPADAAVLLISLVQGLAIRWSLGRRSFALEVEGARLVASEIALFGDCPVTASAQEASPE